MYTSTEVRKRLTRSRIEIFGDILQIAVNGARKTHIMRQGRLSYTQLEEYLNLLVEKKLLTVDRKLHLYKTTPEGLQFLKDIDAIKKLLSPVTQ